MKTWLKWILGVVISVGLVSALLEGWQNHRDRQLLKAAEQADAAQLLTLQHAFPVGTTLADVKVGFADRHLEGSYYNNQIFLEQGTQPSFVWYCGPHTRYLVLDFETASLGEPRLKGITREVRGLNCL